MLGISNSISTPLIPITYVEVWEKAKPVLMNVRGPVERFSLVGWENVGGVKSANNLVGPDYWFRIA